MELCARSLTGSAASTSGRLLHQAAPSGRAWAPSGPRRRSVGVQVRAAAGTPAVQPRWVGAAAAGAPPRAASRCCYCGVMQILSSPLLQALLGEHPLLLHTQRSL